MNEVVEMAGAILDISISQGMCCFLFVLHCINLPQIADPLPLTIDLRTKKKQKPQIRDWRLGAIKRHWRIGKQCDGE
jgi:hypothetical protein